MKFTQIPADTFKNIQLNAGVLLKNFSPETATLSNSDIIGATSGGVSFSDNVSYKDYGEDIDNCPKNTMELKRIDGRDVTMSGTYITMTANLAKKTIGAADANGDKITPRDDLKTDDFEDLWWVGDYSEENTGANAGFVAIHMMHTLSTGGFKFKSGDKAKGTFDFEYTAHYSIEKQNEVPYEVFIHTAATA